jgi:hypothetical protein
MRLRCWRTTVEKSSGAPCVPISIFGDSLCIAVVGPRPSCRPRRNYLTIWDRYRADRAVARGDDRRPRKRRAAPTASVPKPGRAGSDRPRLSAVVDFECARPRASVDHIRASLQGGVASGCAWSMVRAARRLEVRRWTGKAPQSLPAPSETRSAKRLIRNAKNRQSVGSS